MPDTAPLQRSMYCLADRAGRYLVGLESTGPVFSCAPQEALASRFAWISSARAAQAGRDAMANLPGTILGIALLELQADTPGHWLVVSTRLWEPHPTTMADLIR